MSLGAEPTIVHEYIYNEYNEYNGDVMGSYLGCLWFDHPFGPGDPTH